LRDLQAWWESRFFDFSTTRLFHSPSRPGFVFCQSRTLGDVSAQPVGSVRQTESSKTPRNFALSQRGRVHSLTGDRKGTWSLSVTRNRRLTFRIDIAEREIYDLNLEDYHEDKRREIRCP